MKKLLVVVVLLAVVAAAAVLFLIGNIGGIIKGVVERVGTDATQAPVTLETVDLSLSEGTGELRNLVVGNPEGFESEHALKLGQIRVAIDTSTIRSDVVVVKEVIVDGPSVIYEVGTGGTNIGRIQDNVDAYAKRLGAGGGGGESAPADEGGGTKVVIEDLYIRNVDVRIAASFLGGKGASARVKEIHLEDIGKDEGGATPGEVAAVFLEALLEGVIDSVDDLGIDGLKAGGEGLLKGVGDAVEDAGKAVKDLFGGGK